jgi:hypothetical protein
MDVGHRIAPRFTEWFVGRASAALLLRSLAASTTDGTLFSPSATGKVTGDYRRVSMRARIGDAIGRKRAGTDGR